MKPTADGKFLVGRIIAKLPRIDRARAAAGVKGYYEVARAVLWAEWQAGHQLKAAERSGGPGRGHTEKISQPGNSFLPLLEDHKLAQTTAYRWITMSFAPGLGRFVECTVLALRGVAQRVGAMGGGHTPYTTT